MSLLTLDTTAWTDEERVMFVASVAAAAALDCVPPVDISGHSQRRVAGTLYSIDLPAAQDVSALTESVVRARYAADKAARDAAAAAEIAEVQAIAAYAHGDQMQGAKIANVKAAVDDVFAALDAADAAAAAMNAGAPKTAMLAVLTCLRKTLVLERSHLKQHYVRGHFGVR